MRTASSLGGNHPPFAEIELEETPAPVEQKTIPSSQPIPQRAFDPLRARFRDMRMIADYAPYAYQNDGWLFYEQAKFMADVTDDYPHRTAFSAFYPYYQRMGYEQLRTYFTWRTLVREGRYPFVGASYLFLYIYELLSCVGVSDPRDGLEKLTELWPFYREAVPSLDQYLPGWIKDFHICYELPHTFAAFVTERGLQRFYTENAVAARKDTAQDWVRRSGYDIKKSKFYIGNESLANKCITYVFDALRTWCASRNVVLDDLLFYDVRRGEFWKPFAQALYHPATNEPDRRVEMPGHEVYIRRGNRWTLEKAQPFTGTRELVGHIIRKTESCLRKYLKHKHKLTADSRTLVHSERKLKASGLTLAAMDAEIEAAAAAFQRELNRVEVTVDTGSLVKIREEAQDTQVKLTVDEVKNVAPVPAAGVDVRSALSSAPLMDRSPEPPPSIVLQVKPPPPLSSGWGAFAAALTDMEREALTILLRGEDDLKSLADAQGIMLEVLAEGINEKAADFVGDNVLDTDGGFVLYEEYREMIGDAINING
ncbi:MAG: TerB N-terminal domain-containing protein [Defluviitaleaceae bacterium]|nr:TerB N-terminal domain-containing protein [Defluviitaleaceae bacterium]